MKKSHDIKRIFPPHPKNLYEICLPLIRWSFKETVALEYNCVPKILNFLEKERIKTQNPITKRRFSRMDMKELDMEKINGIEIKETEWRTAHPSQLVDFKTVDDRLNSPCPYI